MKHSEDHLKDLPVDRRTFAKYGLDWRIPSDAPPAPREPHRVVGVESGGVKAYDVEVAHSLADREDTETGQAGTPITLGLIHPTDSDFSPPKVRGSRGSWGTYEKVYRADESVKQGIWSITAPIRSAKHPIQPPEGHEDDDQLKRAVEWVRSWWTNLSPAEWLADATKHALKFGFSPWELVYSKDGKGRWYPSERKFRHPSTVDRWILSGDNRQILGALFRPHRDDYYKLFRRGKAMPEGRKLIVPNLDADGLNIEGVAALRPITKWVKLKLLLIKLAGVSAEKYGVPVAWVQEGRYDDAEAAVAAADEDDRKTLGELINELIAMDAPVLGAKADQELSWKSPAGKMPDLIPWIELCNHQISQALANMSSTLATQATGTYALAEVQDDQHLRAALGAYMEVIAPINRRIQFLVRRYWPNLDAVPKVKMAPQMGEDTDQKLDRLAKLMGGKPLPEWPIKLIRLALEWMSVSKVDAEDIKRAGPSNGNGEGGPEDGDQLRDALNEAA